MWELPVAVALVVIGVLMGLLIYFEFKLKWQQMEHRRLSLATEESKIKSLRDDFQGFSRDTEEKVADIKRRVDGLALKQGFKL